MPAEDDRPETVIGTIDGTDFVPSSMAPAAPPEIPGYRVVSSLGQGGMGQVFLAEHLDLKRQVALKVVAAGATANQQTLDRFRAESRAVAAVEHPGICRIFEAGQAGNIPFLAMEYIDGKTLSQVVRDQLPEPQLAASYAQEIAEAIEACHQAGILHRDLKPSNVMLDSKGAIRVMDFGLAKRLGEDENRTRTGEIIGTPGYMAPEQASGVVKQLGPPCDIYAIGAVLYELLTGRPPFATPDIMQTIMLVLTEDPMPPRQLQPNIPIDLQTICLKCMEKKPKKRYESAAAVAADLKRFLDGRPIVARRTSIPEKTLKWIRRNPATSALIVTASVAVIAATAGTAFHVTRLESELSRSERLLGGMTDFGAWLVREHVPRVARLRGGSEQQTELVDRTLQYLKQIQQDASADQELGEYVAQAYVQIADVQADPAFATPERIHQAIGSCENANELYGVILAQQTDARLLTEQAMILLRLSELHQRVQQLEDARTRADQAVALLASCTDERDTELLRAKRQSVSLTEDELTSEQAWLVYRQLHTDCSAPGDTSSNRTRLLAQLDLDLARVLLHANTDLSQHTTDSVADLYQQAVQHCQQISSPDVADDRLHAYALAELCNALVEQGDREEAARVMQTAVEIQRRIVVEIPESTIAMSTLLEYQRELLEVAAGDLIAKQTLADQYLDDAEQLYVRDPVTYRRDLQRAWLMVYRVNQQRKRYEAAHTNLRSAITLATTEVAESDSASANSNLAELMYLQAGLFREEINQRSTATQKLKLLKDAYAAVEEALRIYHQVKDPIDYEEDSTYWQAVSLSHELQEELEREELRLRESGNTSTEGRGKSPDGRPTE